MLLVVVFVLVLMGCGSIFKIQLKFVVVEFILIEIIQVEDNVIFEYKFFEVKKVWECICNKEQCDMLLL